MWLELTVGKTQRCSYTLQSNLFLVAYGSLMTTDRHRYRISDITDTTSVDVESSSTDTEPRLAQQEIAILY